MEKPEWTFWPIQCTLYPLFILLRLILENLNGVCQAITGSMHMPPCSFLFCKLRIPGVHFSLQSEERQHVVNNQNPSLIRFSWFQPLSSLFLSLIQDTTSSLTVLSPQLLLVRASVSDLPSFDDLDSFEEVKCLVERPSVWVGFVFLSWLARVMGFREDDQRDEVRSHHHITGTCYPQDWPLMLDLDHPAEEVLARSWPCKATPLPSVLWLSGRMALTSAQTPRVPPWSPSNF